MFPTSRLTFLLLIAVLTVTSASAQGPATGTPRFGSYGGGPDIINLGNLNAHLDIPVFVRAGRGGFNFTYDLSYDSSVWYNVGQTWQPVTNWGWRGQTEVATGYVSYSSTTTPWCLHNGQYYGQITTYSNWVYHDSFGVFHSFSGSTSVSQGAPAYCNGTTTSMTVTTWDGSGWTLSATGGVLNSVTSSSGSVFNPPVNSSIGAGTATDRNGNEISVNSSGLFTDTLGTTALTVTGGAPNPLVFTYTAPSGAPAAYTMNYTTYTVQTNFGCGISEYGPTSNNLVSEIDLPDGSKYSFSYETTPLDTHSPHYVTGRLASVTFPTGGTISYTYTGGPTVGGVQTGVVCSDGSTAGLQRYTPDTGTTNYWNYSRAQISGNWQTTITTPPDPVNSGSVGDDTVINFSGNFYETYRQVYQGSSTSGALLWVNTTCYNNNNSNCPTTAVSPPIIWRRINPQFGGTQIQSFHTWGYDNFGNLAERDDYDWTTGAMTLLKKTFITYAALGNNLNSFPQSVIVQDASGNTKFRQDVSYDQSGSDNSPCITTAPQHDNTNYSCSFTARANATSITTYTNPSAPSGGITQNFTYDSLGNLRTSKDALNNTTTLAYNPDAWANSYCNPSTTSYAYPVSASNALSQTTSFTYFACSGQLGSAKDPNNQITGSTYDSLLRPTQTNFPDGGQTTITYNSQTSIQTQIKMNATPQYITGTTLLDGLGRTIHKQLNSDPQGVDYTDTTYDAVGRIASVSNPYRTTSDPTYGVTSYQYDALSRPTLIIPPDGSSTSDNISANYSTNTTTVADQAGKKRQTTVDGLGRLTQVTEDPGGLGYVTTYLYDALSNLISVVQNSGRQRTFTFDALSRLVCESNPEIQIATCPNPDNGSYTAGTIRYSYDNNSNLATRQAPAPNQTSSATVTTTYQYDALNRLKQSSYSDGTTPTAAYLYDVSSTNGVTISNPVGRLVRGTTNNCIQTINSYDQMGRTTTQWLNTPSYCGPASFTPTYTYDLAGNLLTGSNGVGVTISYAYDTAARPTTVTSSLVDANHPATLATVDSSVGYYPHGALRKMTPGNGLTQTAAFNKALQPCRLNVNSSAAALGACGDAIPSGNLLDFNYGFNLGSSDNGNVASWTATGQQAFNRSFAYDPLNRLATLNQSSGNATGCSSTFNLSWTYDAWGNRTDQTVTSGTCNPFHATVNTKNQLVDPVNNKYQYDAAGNMIQDANHTYFYDAENRLIQVDGTLGTCSTATACYQYDAFGLRVESNRGSWQMDYLHDLSGNVVADWETSSGYTGWATGYVYLNGGLLAQYQGSTTHFAHPDHLGSTRLLTGLDQSIVQNLDYLPFGEHNSSDSGINTHEFTGDERDSESNLDHTWFRQYSSSLGRWMTPDPAGLAVVDPTNPQSWNRYGYVLNNPLALIDPTGLCGDINWMVQSSAGTTSGVEVGPCPSSYQPWLSQIGSPNWACSWFGLDCGASASSNTGTGGGGSTLVLQVKVFFQALAKPPSTGPGSCIQVALDAAAEPLQAIHEAVHPLEENLPPLAAMAQSPMPVSTTAIATELWSMTTGAAVATGRGPVADDARTLVQQGGLILAGTAAAIVPKVQAAVGAVEEALPEATLLAADAIGVYAVAKEGIAAALGKCKP